MENSIAFLKPKSATMSIKSNISLPPPLSQQQFEKEAEKINQIPDFKTLKIGLVSISEFGFESDEYELIAGERVFN